MWTPNQSVISTALQRELAAVESAWSAFRSDRDSRLTKSDWTQVSDAPVDQVAWATYRQQLRDLPSIVTNPNAVTWPDPPGSQP